MAGPYEWLIGTRHLRSSHRRGFVSFVALISVMGLTLGVATLVVVLSVMNGFERELRVRILSVTSHAMLMGIHGTIDPNSIGKQESLGCIRMRNEDVAIVFEMLVDSKSTVTVNVSGSVQMN